MRNFKKNYNVLLIFVLLKCSFGFCQEFLIPTQNQYIADDPFLISPAYAGIGDCWRFRGTGFEQWIAIENSPGTQSLSVDGKISDRSGVGVILFNDKNGSTSQRGAQVSFAHHLTLNEHTNQYLSFGISYKFTQFGIDTSKFNNGDPDNPINPGLTNITVNNSNIDVGFLYRLGNFYVSGNLVNILDKQIDDFNPVEPTTIRSYYMYTGYIYHDIQNDIEIEPSLLYQSFVGDGRTTADINLKVRKINRGDYYWVGVSLRSLVDQSFKPLSVYPMFGVDMRKFYVAYGYQINVNEVFQAVGGQGSHLITLGFDFGCKKSNCGCTY